MRPARLGLLQRPADGRAGPIIVVAVIGILAAVALPAYQDYTTRAKVATAWVDAAPARAALERYLAEQHRPPASLEDAGVSDHLSGNRVLALKPDTMELSLQTGSGELLMTPQLDKQRRVFWLCRAGEGLRPGALPRSCQSGPQP